MDVNVLSPKQHFESVLEEMYSCSKFLGLFSSLGSTLTIFCIILKVDFLCSAPSNDEQKSKMD